MTALPSPWPQGDTAPSWLLPLVAPEGNVPTSGLSSASSFSLFFRNSNGTSFTGTGTFSGLTSVNGGIAGTITYNPSASDSATVGLYHVWLVITFPAATVQSLDLGMWQVISK